ncbi:MAG: MBL fold metallo-hydrolase [Syntrophorhabdaceae bacterium]|nr:MBL fold metallo-hydrolase [Syntrophorhabdaceae bacterium]
MTASIFIIVFVFLFGVFSVSAQDSLEKDTIDTSSGPLEITFIGHGSLMMKFKGKIIHIDPVTKETDYTKLPKADLILITHEHYDHLDQKAIDILKTNSTQIVISKSCADKVSGGLVMGNGDVKQLMDIKIEAVPAYNLVHKRENGMPFHTKGQGNGYVLTFGDKRVYIAGDTENTPEMKALKNIDYAFLPMNLPFTMTPEMVADAAKAFKPKVLYPYHYGETDTSKLISLLKDTPDIEIRIRKMK